MEDGSVDVFAEKMNNTKSGDFNANQTLEKHRRLKEVGVKTFDQMFIASDDMEYKPEYLELVQERLNPALKKNQVFTKDGIKDVADYTQDDGEILKLNLENPGENTSWEEIEKLSHIPNIQTDLTNIKVEYKEKITLWKGNLMDESFDFHYSALQTVEGYLDVRRAQSFSADSLQTGGVDLDIYNAQSFSVESLTEVRMMGLRNPSFTVPKPLTNGRVLLSFVIVDGFI